MSEPATTNGRDVCFKELLNSFSAWANENLAKTPEASALALTVDWEVGRNDFPVGSFVGRTESPAELLSMLEQLVKMTNMTCARLGKVLADLRSQAKTEPTPSS